MKYAHILLAVTEERWAIEPSKMQAILDFLTDQASGVKYSAEEIEARLTQKAEKEVARRDGQVAILPLRGVIANRMSMMDDISGG
ncbi:MAG: S49 family peptidase, partial [Rhizobiaceae bacterium]